MSLCKHRLEIFLAAMSWAFLTASMALAGQAEGGVKCFTFEGRNECVFSMELNGEIQLGTVNEVKRLLDRRREWIGAKKTNEAGTLIIDSPGGNLAAAMAIGRMLRAERVPVFIPKGHECVSACIIVLAGAVTRLYVGKVGIHRPFFDLPSGSQPLTPEQVRSGYERVLDELRAYLREMNVSERLIDDMLAINPADVRYLSTEQLYGYGLRWHDPIEQETIDLQEAQALGLDRREYIRREALRKVSCNSLTNIDELIACNQRVMKFGQ